MGQRVGANKTGMYNKTGLSYYHVPIVAVMPT